MADSPAVEEVRHNTSLLEVAVDHVVRKAMLPTLQAEAEARYLEGRAIAIRRMATGGAVAIAAIGLGIAIYLSSRAPQQPTVVSTQEVLSPEPASEEVPLREQPGVTTTDFTIFREVSVRSGGRSWQITAGHRFAREEDQAARQWSDAWCYTNQIKDGVLFQLPLVKRLTKNSRPSENISGAPETLNILGVDRSEFLYLATQCPWLDEGKFPEGEIVIPKNLKFPTTDKSPSLTADKNTARSGTSLGAPFKSSLSACIDACRKETQCRGFVHDGSCRLLSTVGNPVPRPGVSSGVKK